MSESQFWDQNLVSVLGMGKLIEVDGLKIREVGWKPPEEGTIMKNRNEGFTLIEMAVVIAVIGILSAMSLSNYLTFTAKARRSEAILAMNQIVNMQLAYFTEKGYYWPSPTEVALPLVVAPEPPPSSLEVIFIAKGESMQTGDFAIDLPSGRYYDYYITSDNENQDFWVIAIGNIDSDLTEDNLYMGRDRKLQILIDDIDGGGIASSGNGGSSPEDSDPGNNDDTPLPPPDPGNNSDTPAPPVDQGDNKDTPVSSTPDDSGNNQDGSNNKKDKEKVKKEKKEKKE